MKQLRNIMIGVAAVLAVSIPAAAQPVHIEGEPRQIPLVEDGGSTVEVTDFELIGYSEPGILAVSFGTVDRHVREDVCCLSFPGSTSALFRMAAA